MGLFQASESLLQDSFSDCCQLAASAPHSDLGLGIGIFYDTRNISWALSFSSTVENISLLQEFWNWIHLNRVNVLLLQVVVENHHLFIFEQTIIENLVHVSNDTNSYVFRSSLEAIEMCCSNQLSGASVTRDLVSCSTSELAPTSVLPGLLSVINCLW